MTFVLRHVEKEGVGVYNYDDICDISDVVIIQPLIQSTNETVNKTKLT